MSSIIIDLRSLCILVAICLILSLGCASKPVQNLNSIEGNWRARALIKDDNKRSFIVKLNFNAVRSKQMRMDVMSALDTPIATLTADEKEVRYILFDSKRFYYGPPQADIMKPILSIPFHPRWLHNILFEFPIMDKGWVCEANSRGWIEECRERNSAVRIRWYDRKGDQRTILIQHPKATLQINVLSYKPKVEDRKNLFLLEAPESFQKLKVR